MKGCKFPFRAIVRCSHHDRRPSTQQVAGVPVFSLPDDGIPRLHGDRCELVSQPPNLIKIELGKGTGCLEKLDDMEPLLDPSQVSMLLGIVRENRLEHFSLE